jgi:hypothetical protein
MYESPIELLYSDLRIETLKDEADQVIVRAVQEIAPSVNKEELIKALQYDRDQYLKGYTDGLAYTPPVKTHYDQVKAMSLEEMSELFADNDCGYCRIHDFCFAKGCQINCEDVWLDWLKQEVEE